MPDTIGRFVVQGELARGGMGVVYAALDPATNQQVAVKVLRAGEDATEVQRERFRREAAALRRLDHPNLVRVLELGESQGRAFIAMERVEGGSLAERLRTGPLAPAAAVALVAAVAHAVAHAHALGILHRDIKPENVLLDRSGSPRLTDFGLARAADARSSLTRTGQLLGTPGYLAPEQAAGKPDLVGPHTDVYGLGALLYAALTGEPPYAGEGALDVLVSTIGAEVPSPAEANPAVDSALDALTRRCLAKEPADRPPSAEALADELERLLTPARRGPGWAGAAVLLLGALTAVGVAVVGIAIVGGQGPALPSGSADASAPDEPRTTAPPAPAPAHERGAPLSTFDAFGPEPMGVLLCAGRRVLLASLPASNRAVLGSVALCEAATGRRVAAWPGGTGFVASSPDGSTAAFSQPVPAGEGATRPPARVLWVSGEDGGVLGSWPVAHRPTAACFLGPQRLLLSTTDLGRGALGVLDLRSGLLEPLLRDVAGTFVSVAVGAGRIAVMVEPTWDQRPGDLLSLVRVWEVGEASGRIALGSPVYERRYAAGEQVALGGSRAAPLLAVGSHSYAIWVVDLQRKTQKPLLTSKVARRTSRLTSRSRRFLTFADGGRVVLAAVRNGNVYLWRLGSAKLPLTVAGGRPLAGLAGPDAGGRVLILGRTFRDWLPTVDTGPIRVEVWTVDDLRAAASR